MSYNSFWLKELCYSRDELYREYPIAIGFDIEIDQVAWVQNHKIRALTKGNKTENSRTDPLCSPSITVCDYTTILDAIGIFRCMTKDCSVT